MSSSDQVCPRGGCMGLLGYGRKLLDLKDGALLMECQLNAPIEGRSGHGCGFLYLAVTIDDHRFRFGTRMRIIDDVDPSVGVESLRAKAEAELAQIFEQITRDKADAEDKRQKLEEEERVRAVGVDNCCHHAECPLYRVAIPPWRDPGARCILCGSTIRPHRRDEVKNCSDWYDVICPAVHPNPARIVGKGKVTFKALKASG